MIKYFWNDTFEKKFTMTAIVSTLTVVSTQKTKLKQEIPWHFHITQKSPLLKKEGPIFLLFDSWSAVFISMFGLSQSFSDNSSLIILVDIQRLKENGKWIFCVSNGIYILFKRNFIVAPLYCFIKLFDLNQI